MRFSVSFRLWFPVIAFCLAFHGIDASALSLEETLAAMPPENGAAADALFTQVLNEPDTLLFALCERIYPPDQAPDAQAQFALYGVAKHVVRPGMEAQRMRVARVFEIALDRAAHPDVRRFFMAQLRVCGDDTSLRVLERYVCDPDLFDDAIQSVAAIGGFEAVSPLFMLSCPGAPGMDASVKNALLRMSGLPGYTPEESGLSPELLAAMAAPDAVEDRARIASLCRDALTKEGIKPQYKTMALQALVRAAGADSLPELLQAAQSSEPAIWGTALFLTAELAGDIISQAWVSKLPELSETVRPQVIAMLGRRNDPVAREAVLAALADTRAEMRMAACQSVSRTHGADVTGPLMDALKRAESAKEIEAVKGALLRVPGLPEAATAKLQSDPAYADGLDAAQKSACLEIIAERQADGFRDITVAGLEDEDARVRRTACATLAAIGVESDFDLFYQRLLAEERDAEADAARNAIAALAKRLQVGDAAAELAGGKLAGATGDSRARLVKTLGALGSAKALEIVRAAADQALFGTAPDADFALLLLDTLGVWQTPEGGAVLEDLWQRLQDPSLRQATLKNYIVAVQRTVSDAARQRDALTAIRDRCIDDAERQTVAEAISKAEAELNKK